MLFRYSTGGEGTVKWDIVMVQRLYSYTLIPLQTLDITHVPQMLINLDIITIGYGIKKLDRNRQWRIQGCANTRGAAPTYYLAKSLLKNCKKMKEIGQQGASGDTSLVPLLDPPIELWFTYESLLDILCIIYVQVQKFE